MRKQYDFMKHQFLKIGTRIYDVGSKSCPRVDEWEITDEIKPDGFGYLSIVLKGISFKGSLRVRLEWLVMGVHKHTSYFLTREEAEQKVQEMLERN